MYFILVQFLNSLNSRIQSPFRIRKSGTAIPWPGRERSPGPSAFPGPGSPASNTPGKFRNKASSGLSPGPNSPPPFLRCSAGTVTIPAVGRSRSGLRAPGRPACDPCRRFSCRPGSAGRRCVNFSRAFVTQCLAPVIPVFLPGAPLFRRSLPGIRLPGGLCRRGQTDPGRSAPARPCRAVCKNPGIPGNR